MGRYSGLEPASGIVVRTLGRWEIAREGTPLEEFPNQPVRLALLTYLAVEREVSRGALTHLLWTDSAPDAARRSLNQAVYLVRRALGPDVVETEGDVVRAGEALWADVVAFREAVQAGENSQALALYGGRFHPAEGAPPTAAFEQWAERWASRVTRDARLVRSKEVQRLREGGRRREALELARSWVEDDPHEDEAHHALIELLHLSGHRSAALAQYDTYRTMVEEELGVAPLPDTVELVTRIRDTPAGAPPGPDAAAGTDEDTASAGRRPPPSRLPRRRAVMLAAVAAAMVGGAAYWARHAPGPQQGPRVDPTTGRVAVFNFEDLSAAQELGPLARGLTREVIHRLADLEEIEVVPYHGVSDLAVDDLANDTTLAKLRAGTVVLGTLREQQGRLVALVQVVDAVDEEYRDSHRLEYPAEEVLPLVDELAESVASMLRRYLGRELRERRQRRAASTQEGWLLVQTAHDLAEDLWRGHGQIPAHRAEDAGLVLDRAEGLLREATRLEASWAEPRLLQARVGVARAKLLGRGPDPGEYDAQLWRALAWTDSARRLAPESSAVLAVTGGILSQISGSLRGVDPDSAGVLLLRADSALLASVAADEKNADAWASLSEVRRQRGDISGARDAAVRALEADVYLAEAERVYQRAFVTSMELGDGESALQWIDRGARAFPLDPRFPTGRLALVSWIGRPRLSVDSVLATLATLDALDPPTSRGLEREYQYIHRRAMGAGAIARAGETERARTILDSLATEVAGVENWSGPFGWDEAQVSLVLGDTTRAERALGTWLASYWNAQAYLEESLLFRALTGDPARLTAIRGRAQALRRTR